MHAHEHHRMEQKSLQKITGKTADWPGLARECVCFANAHGGTICIGVEDGQLLPPPDQAIPEHLAEEVFKRVTGKTHNVILPLPTVVTAENGGQFLRVDVPRSPSIAATTDGRYSVRIADECVPVLPENLVRLVSEKGSYDWETRQTSVRLAHADPEQRARLLLALRSSERVKPFVKEKRDDDLFDHYSLVSGSYLTQLGVLWIGTREARASLPNAPVIQYFRYDGTGRKVDKEPWDDFSLNPAQLLAAVEALPVWREAVEVPAGLFRTAIPNYDLEVVRELVANAMAHRMYTLPGDVRIALYTDRLEVCSPGPLPLGVTARNILHKSSRRNEHMSRLFHDLRLMEREGSGYDRIYRVQLEAGKPIPEVDETDDAVCVTVRGRDLNLDALRVVERAARTNDLSDREIIAFGLLAQSGPKKMTDVARMLGLPNVPTARDWLEGLIRQNLVVRLHRGPGTMYSVDPTLLRSAGYQSRTTLLAIEDHRLRELVLTDVSRYPESALSEIHDRIGPEIPKTRVQHMLRTLVRERAIQMVGTKRWARYFPFGEAPPSHPA